MEVLSSTCALGGIGAAGSAGLARADPVFPKVFAALGANPNRRPEFRPVRPTLDLLRASWRILFGAQLKQRRRVRTLLALICGLRWNRIEKWIGTPHPITAVSAS